MLFCPNILLYATILVVAFLSMLIVGSACVKLLPELNTENNPLANVFVSLMSGYVVVISLYALFCTRCNTIMLLSVLIVMAYICLLRQREVKREVATFTEISINKFGLFAAFFSLVVFFVYYYVFFVRAYGEIWCDYTFYSNVSCHIGKNHCENANIFSDTCNATNYHWGDLWLTSLFGRLFNANYLYVLLLVTYPILTVICVIGGIAVSYTIIKKTILSMILGVSLVFAVPLLTLIIHWTSPIVIGSKLVLVYCFVLSSLLFFLSGRLRLSCVSLLFLVPFYSTVAPGVLAMTCVLSIIDEYNNGKKMILCIFNRVVLLSIGLTALYLLFYSLQKGESANQTIFLYSNPLKNALNFWVKRSARSLVLLPGIAGLFLLKKIRRTGSLSMAYSWIIAIVVGIVVSSFVGGAAKQIMLDGGQITQNYTTPILNITCWVTSIIIISKAYGGRHVNIGVPLISLVYLLVFVLFEKPQEFVSSEHYYSSEENNEIVMLKNELSDGDNVFGYYRNYEIEENFNTHKSRIRMCYPMDIMPHLIDNGFYAPFCLSALDIPDNLEPMWNEKKQSELFKFVEREKRSGSIESDELLIMRFISERDIKYIVVEYGCDLPNYLLGHVKIVYDGKDKVYKLCN